MQNTELGAEQRPSDPRFVRTCGEQTRCLRFRLGITRRPEVKVVTRNDCAIRIGVTRGAQIERGDALAVIDQGVCELSSVSPPESNNPERPRWRGTYCRAKAERRTSGVIRRPRDVADDSLGIVGQDLLELGLGEGHALLVEDGVSLLQEGCDCLGVGGEAAGLAVSGSLAFHDPVEVGLGGVVAE